MLSSSRLALAAIALALAFAPAHAAEGFSFADSPGDHLDILFDGKVVARYMYAHDTSTKEKADLTYKPYLHVFDADGTAPITKGPGGQFTHHRGIFPGWMKISHNGKTYDRWHMKGGDIVHQKFAEQHATKDSAAFTSLTHWVAEPGQAMIEEARTMSIRKLPAPGRLLITLETKLSAPLGDIKLDGDPEHAGVQFRPANEIDAKKTTYIFPKADADPTKDRDYPWVGETFSLNGKDHSVVIFNDPKNPKETRFSAYRDYGRFGAFPVAEIKKGESLTLKYGFLIAEGALPSVEYVQQQYDAFAGLKASPVPQTTVKNAAVKAAPKKNN